MFSKVLITIGAGLVLFAGVLGLVRKNISPETALKSLKTNQKASASPAPKTINSNELTNQLDSITEKYPNLDIGIAVIDLNTGQSYTYGDKLAYYGASTTKVLVAAMYLHEVETGKRTLKDRIGGISAADRITAMIEKSDNDAWTALRGALGYNNMDTYARQVGMTTFASRDNLINASDMAKLLQQLYQGELINKANTSLLLGHMQKSIRNYIAPALGSGYTVYHKAGWLDDRLMDTAIVTNGTHKYVLVIFSKAYTGNYDFKAGADVFSYITKTVNTALN